MLLMVATVLLVIGAVVGLLPAIMTPMMFDDPKALESPVTITLAISIATFPVVCAVAVLLSWLVFLLPVFASLPYRHTLALGLTALPLINLSIAAASLVWIEYFNDGFFY
ncbi:MAG TPA: hypothetical protein VLS96_14585 [Nodosilinea sp.]|nr:hypothetical protein [Nodosilinea sp.]